MALTDKQIRFCDEYLIDLNATQAAIRAGYSKKTADVQAARLLVNVKVSQHLQKKREVVSNKLEITLDMILEGYRKLAFYDARKFYNEAGELLKITDLDDETAFALAGFEVSEDKDFVKGTNTVVGYTKKIKMSERKSALDSLCKVLGYNAPEKQDVNINGFIDFLKASSVAK